MSPKGCNRSSKAARILSPGADSLPEKPDSGPNCCTRAPGSCAASQFVIKVLRSSQKQGAHHPERNPAWGFSASSFRPAASRSSPGWKDGALQGALNVARHVRRRPEGGGAVMSEEVRKGRASSGVAKYAGGSIKREHVASNVCYG